MSLKNAHILALDDDEDVLLALRLLLKSRVKAVSTEKNPEKIPGLMAQHSFDLVLLDMNYRSAINTGNEGLFWLRKIRELVPDQKVVMMTAYGDVELAVRSLKEGAADFILKPWENQKLFDTLESLLVPVTSPSRKTSPTSARVKDFDLVGQSPALQEVLAKLEKVAPTDANILILGENGTGKELIARTLHQQSLRKDKPFVSVDVGALTESLFESELFGYKKGAFTDAREDRPGRIEAAHQGTLFLDEIGNISLLQQSRLLSVLQNRQVVPLGSNTPIPVDIRLICATNAPIYEMARQRRFRTDLIYRINTVEIALPPLRERTGDIVLLARHFVGLYAAKYGKPRLELHAETLKKLRDYPWPGNIRELQNATERAVIMADGDWLMPQDYELGLRTLPEGMGAERGDEELNLKELERSTILKVIEKNQGNISKAARELGLTRAALYRRLDKYDM